MNSPGDPREKRPAALVTGCSTGIGYETALLLARNGWRVFATLRDLKKSGPLRAASAGSSLEILPMDVDQPGSVRRAVAEVLRKAGAIDLLVNNAGWGAFGSLEEFTDEEIRAQYETNVFGLMRVTKEVLPSMRARRSGRILHIGSLAGRMTFTGIALYCSTKHAVEALTEGLRTELRPFNVQVAVVEPGNIKTPFKANRRKAKAFLSGRSAYQGVLQKVLEFGNRTSPWTPGPQAVAQKVLEILQTPRMAVRYPVGLDAVLFPAIRWCLPMTLYDLLMERLYGRFLKGHRPPVQEPTQGPAASGRTALVTGANSGYGLEIAKLLVQRGYRVYATYRDKARSLELFALARSAPTLHPLPMDVTRRASVQGALRTVSRKEGRLDVLVNNAGSVTAGFLEDLSDGELNGQFDVNVFGTLRVTRAAVPLMRVTGGGRILNLGSISGRVVFPGIGAYAASKFALRSLTEGMRMELRPFGIEVGEIAPGTFATKVVANTRMAAKMRDRKSAYAPFRAQVEGLVEKEFRKAAPASIVAGLAGSLLELPRWRVRPVILAGTDAKVMAFLKERLPDAWFEWLFRLAFPWSRFPR